MSSLRIFVSHSSKDRAFVEELAQILREAGADVWHSSQRGTMGILPMIFTQEIESRPNFIVVLSSGMPDVYWVNLECGLAINQGHETPEQRILPILLPPFKRSDYGSLGYLKAYIHIEGRTNRECIEKTLITLDLPSLNDIEEFVACLAVGEKLARKKQYHAAISEFERAAQLVPGNEMGWSWLGYAYLMQRQPGNAIDAFERVLAIQKDDAITWNNKGVALHGMKRYRDAIAAYHMAINLGSWNDLAWRNMACTFDAMGFTTEANEARQAGIQSPSKPVRRYTSRNPKPIKQICVSCVSINCRAALRPSSRFCNWCGTDQRV